MLQEAALAHSIKAGWGMKQMSERGCVWILSKLRMELQRSIDFGEELQVTTWSKAVSGLKAFREFEIFADGEKVASASSIWVYFDLERKRICTIPENAASDYGIEGGSALDFNLERWKTSANFEPSQSSRISVRFSDFDTNGHVNNTIYVDYAEHLVSLLAWKPEIKIFTIQFSKEISSKTDFVNVGFNGDENGGNFKIFSGSDTFAVGDMLFK